MFLQIEIGDDLNRKHPGQVRAGGGILSEDDFESYEAAVVEPLAIGYRGLRVLTPPPPSGGLTSLQILKVLEQFDLADLELWGAEYFHLFADAAKHASSALDRLPLRRRDSIAQGDHDRSLGSDGCVGRTPCGDQVPKRSGGLPISSSFEEIGVRLQSPEE